MAPNHEYIFFSLCSNKKAVNIPDEVLDAATSAEVTALNLSKNVLNKVPERWERWKMWKEDVSSYKLVEEL